MGVSFAASWIAIQAIVLKASFVSALVLIQYGSMIGREQCSYISSDRFLLIVSPAMEIDHCECGSTTLGIVVWVDSRRAEAK